MRKRSHGNPIAEEGRHDAALSAFLNNTIIVLAHRRLDDAIAAAIAAFLDDAIAAALATAFLDDTTAAFLDDAIAAFLDIAIAAFLDDAIDANLDDGLTTTIIALLDASAFALLHRTPSGVQPPLYRLLRLRHPVVLLL